MRFGKIMCLLVAAVVLAAVPAQAMRVEEATAKLEAKGWITNKTVFGWDIVRGHLYDVAYAPELQECDDLVLVSGFAGGGGLWDRAPWWDKAQTEEELWDLLVKYVLFNLVSVNGVPWQETPYRDIYLRSLAKVYPAVLDPAWQKYFLDPSYNGLINYKLQEPDRSEIYLNAEDIGKMIVVKGNESTEIQLPALPYRQNGEVMVPVRAAFENVGAVIEYDQATKSIVIKDKGHTVVVQQGSKLAQVDGETVEMPVAVSVRNNSTFVPAKFMSEKLEHRFMEFENEGKKGILILEPKVAFWDERHDDFLRGW